MPRFKGNGGKGGFILVVAQDETMLPAMSQQPLALLGVAEAFQQAGVAAYVNRQAGLVLAGARKGGVAQGVVVGGCVALARTLAAGYLAIEKLLLHCKTTEAGNRVQRQIVFCLVGSIHPHIGVGGGVAQLHLAFGAGGQFGNIQ